jgi:malonyl-CoA O-methyltransferase
MDTAKVGRSMNDRSDKIKIAQSFGQAAAIYHTQASLQQDCATKLLQILDLWEVPAGKILEVGCGTGFLTQGLCDRFPNHPLQVTDFSAEMLAFCQAHLQIGDDCAPVSFQQMDGEKLETEETYSLIIANFVIQWFTQPVETLRLWLKRLQPHGVLWLAFPTCHSFPEWREECEALQIPFTANELPDSQELVKALSSFSQDSYLQEVFLHTSHQDAGDFLRGLKAIGAGVNTSGQKLSAAEMKRLIRHWNNAVKDHQGVLQVHHHVAFLLIRRYY